MSIQHTILVRIYCLIFENFTLALTYCGKYPDGCCGSFSKHFGCPMRLLLVAFLAPLKSFVSVLLYTSSIAADDLYENGSVHGNSGVERSLGIHFMSPYIHIILF